MGLQDHELKWLTNHLGHTAKVHLTHYRATSGLIERLAIAKIMLLQEKNNVGKFSGKKLSEIQFQGEGSKRTLPVFITIECCHRVHVLIKTNAAHG